MTMSSVSAVMEACAAGSLETILGWNTLNGFLGKKQSVSYSLSFNTWGGSYILTFLSLHFTTGVNICSRRRDKILFTRSRLDSHGCLSRLVENQIQSKKNSSVLR